LRSLAQQGLETIALDAQGRRAAVHVHRNARGRTILGEGDGKSRPPRAAGRAPNNDARDRSRVAGGSIVDHDRDRDRKAIAIVTLCLT
jgi:hypothetical protein